MGKINLTRAIWALAPIFAFLGVSVVAHGDMMTSIHEKGRCAIRGQCGKQGFFGKDLPCPDNHPAQSPEDSTREKLVKICGHQWDQGDICCDDDQASNLSLKLSFLSTDLATA